MTEVQEVPHLIGEAVGECRNIVHVARLRRRPGAGRCSEELVGGDRWIRAALKQRAETLSSRAAEHDEDGLLVQVATQAASEVRYAVA